jgi:hypothetical protein
MDLINDAIDVSSAAIDIASDSIDVRERGEKKNSCGSRNLV